MAEVFKPGEVIAATKNFNGHLKSTYEVLAVSYTICLSSGLVLIKDDYGMMAWYPASVFMYAHDLTSLGAQEYEEIMASIGETDGI